MVPFWNGSGYSNYPGDPDLTDKLVGLRTQDGYSAIPKIIKRNT